ncbi:MAG: A/G-specific adenine glycosylase [Gammaproteobacteria bacterium]|nr:A/G-specific adenine glycosylase [Gammaproteobacteria bacterium]
MKRSGTLKRLPAQTEFSARLRRWHRRHGRHDLPWQWKPTPYRVWVSEIMLQQTQVASVIPYFNRFMRRFRSVRALASADLDEVLGLWSGLGYYARARHLHEAAKLMIERHGGAVPGRIDQLAQLPGIGRSTAGAILSLSLGLPCPVLDGNAKRVLCRYHGVRGWPAEKKVEQKLWRLAESHLPRRAAAVHTQALMDLGATLCTRSSPRCDVCPLHEECVARREGLQDSLPAPRPKRKVPVRRTALAVIENGHGRILLQRRPPAGIWGGLWSLPECPPDADVIDWVRERFGWPVIVVGRVPALRHSFTHFHLDIEPVRLQLRRDEREVRDTADQAWLTPAAGMRRGLAAPIRKLLGEIYGVDDGGGT